MNKPQSTSTTRKLHLGITVALSLMVLTLLIGKHTSSKPSYKVIKQHLPAIAKYKPSKSLPIKRKVVASAPRVVRPSAYVRLCIDNSRPLREFKACEK